MPALSIFFDRDGVVNRRLPDDYVRGIDDFEFLPGVSRAIETAHKHGYLAVVVTNQRGIARGLMTEEDLASVHNWMQTQLRRHGGHAFDAIYHCPHDTTDACNCRKPRPGMLLRAARDLDLDLKRSWIIGDSESDVEAGIAAGCRTILVAPDRTPTRATAVAPSLTQAMSTIGSGE